MIYYNTCEASIKSVKIRRIRVIRVPIPAVDPRAKYLKRWKEKYRFLEMPKIFSRLKFSIYPVKPPDILVLPPLGNCPVSIYAFPIISTYLLAKHFL